MNLDYMVIFIITIVLTLGVQWWLKSTYGKWQRVRAASGLTGAQTARVILDANGLTDVAVEQVKGELSDHYDPSKRVVRLSTHNFSYPSVAANAVAAHEVGHAIQHAEKYTPLVVRSRLVPVAQLGSNLGPWLIIAGLIFNFTGLAGIGIALFGAAVLFQLVTLPVEFNASARAHVQLQTLGIATQGEVQGTKSVLNAAAMTYVAATATSVLYLLYYVSMFLGRRN